MMTPNAEFEYDLYDYKFCAKVNVLYNTFMLKQVMRY